MVSQTAFQLTLDFPTSKPVVVVPSAEQVSSDAGLLPFRQLDERIVLTRQFAEVLTDRRHGGYVDHFFLGKKRDRSDIRTENGGTENGDGKRDRSDIDKIGKP